MARERFVHFNAIELTRSVRHVRFTTELEMHVFAFETRWSRWRNGKRVPIEANVAKIHTPTEILGRTQTNNTLPDSDSMNLRFALENGVERRVEHMVKGVVFVSINIT